MTEKISAAQKEAAKEAATEAIKEARTTAAEPPESVLAYAQAETQEDGSVHFHLHPTEEAARKAAKGGKVVSVERALFPGKGKHVVKPDENPLMHRSITYALAKFGK